MEEKQQSSGFTLGKALSSWLATKRPNGDEEPEKPTIEFSTPNNETPNTTDDGDVVETTIDPLAFPEALKQGMLEFAEQHWTAMVSTADSKVRDHVDRQLADAAEAVEHARQQAEDAAQKEATMRGEWESMRETLNRQTAELEDANGRVMTQSKSLQAHSETIKELQDMLVRREEENAQRADAFDKHLETMRLEMTERETKLSEEFAEKESEMQETIASIQGKLQLTSSDLEEANTRNDARSEILDKKDAELIELKAVFEVAQQQADLDLRKVQEENKTLQADSQRREEVLSTKLSQAQTDLQSRTGDLIDKLKSTEIQLKKHGNDVAEAEAVAEWQAAALKEKDELITKIRAASDKAESKSNTVLNALHQQVATLTEQLDTEQSIRSDAEGKVTELGAQLSLAREDLRKSERNVSDANAELARKSEELNEHSKVMAGLTKAANDEALPEQIAELEQDNSTLLAQLTAISEANPEPADGEPDLEAIREQLLRNQTELRKQNEMLVNARESIAEREKELEAKNGEIDELNGLLQSNMVG